MIYTQLTLTQIYQIYALKKMGHDPTQIAKCLGVHKSTIGRELDRNQGQRGYRPKQAHEKTLKRPAQRAQNRITAETWAQVEEKLRLDWSPEQISGYRTEEVIGQKRVSIFSPGPVVLEHVPAWLKTASEEGEYEGQTVFLRKDGISFNAEIRITPTFRDGQQTGYCGVTTPPDTSKEADAMPYISPLTKVFAGMVIMRLPFLTANLIPVLIGAAWAAVTRLLSPFPWLLFTLTFFGAAALHVAANTFNNYFDWTSGTDKVNNDYFLPFTGGSRSMELGLISEKGMLKVGLVSLGISFALGLTVMFLSNQPLLILFGLAGAFSAYFYTAPPLQLAARKGLGELLIGLNFGPLAGCRRSQNRTQINAENADSGPKTSKNLRKSA